MAKVRINYYYKNAMLLINKIIDCEFQSRNLLFILRKLVVFFIMFGIQNKKRLKIYLIRKNGIHDETSHYN